MEKQKFQKPEVRLVRLEEGGIICASGEGGEGGSAGAKRVGMMESYSTGSTTGWFNM